MNSVAETMNCKIFSNIVFIKKKLDIPSHSSLGVIFSVGQKIDSCNKIFKTSIFDHPKRIIHPSMDFGWSCSLKFSYRSVKSGLVFVSVS